MLYTAACSPPSMNKRHSQPTLHQFHCSHLNDCCRKRLQICHPPVILCCQTIWVLDTICYLPGGRRARAACHIRRAESLAPALVPIARLLQLCLLHPTSSFQSPIVGLQKGANADPQLAQLLQLGSPTLTWSCRVADCLPLMLWSRNDVNVAISTASLLPAPRSWNEVPSLRSSLPSSAGYRPKVP